MNKTSLTRRLLAGAVGFGVGVMGAVALVAPAQAGAQQPKQESSVQFNDDCEGTSVTLKSGTHYDAYDWYLDIEKEEDVRTIDVQAGETHTVWIDARQGDISVTFKGAPPHYEPWTHTWKKPKKCEDESKPKAKYDLLPLVGCDALVFAVRNQSDRDGDHGVDIKMSLTPHQDTSHGHAPGFIPLLDADRDDDGFYDEPKDNKLVDKQKIAAGEKVTLLIGPGESHAHGFSAVDGLTVTVEIAKADKDGKGKVLEKKDVTWDPKGLKCKDDGKGGEKKDKDKKKDKDDELPVTGISTGLIALGALALLATGGGLALAARRRRVTFTA